MSTHSSVIYCFLYVFSGNLALWIGQLNAIHAWTLEPSRSSPSFSIRYRAWFGRRCYFTVYNKIGLQLSTKYYRNKTTGTVLGKYYRRKMSVKGTSCYQSVLKDQHVGQNLTPGNVLEMTRLAEGRTLWPQLLLPVFWTVVKLKIDKKDKTFLLFFFL